MSDSSVDLMNRFGRVVRIHHVYGETDDTGDFFFRNFIDQICQILAAELSCDVRNISAHTRDGPIKPSSLAFLTSGPAFAYLVEAKKGTCCWSAHVLHLVQLRMRRRTRRWQRLVEARNGDD